MRSLEPVHECGKEANRGRVERGQEGSDQAADDELPAGWRLEACPSGFDDAPGGGMLRVRGAAARAHSHSRHDPVEATPTGPTPPTMTPWRRGSSSAATTSPALPLRAATSTRCMSQLTTRTARRTANLWFTACSWRWRLSP